MNLTKLFEAQAKLEARINENHPPGLGEDRLSSKTLALIMELGELVQNWRGFKYWSNHRNPRTTLNCEICRGAGGHYNTYDDAKNKTNRKPCKYCGGTGAQEGVNPLLEEYVDCLHFIISIGLDLNADPTSLFIPIFEDEANNEMFLSIINDVLTLDLKRDDTLYQWTFTRIAGLGVALGFTSEQIESAYYTKNKINHARQENNY